MADQDTFLEHLQAGKNFCKQGKQSEAQAELQKAIGLNPNNAEAHDYMGVSLACNGKDKEAISYYEKAIELDRNYARAYDHWGSALFNLNQYGEAINKYKEAGNRNPNYAKAYFNWAHVLEKLQKPRKAIALYKKAIKVNRNYAKAYNNWGIILSKLKRYEEAISKYQKAIQIKSRYAGAYFNLGLALFYVKRYEEAIKQYQIAKEINPDFAYAYNNIAETLWIEGRYEEAWEEWRHTRSAFQRAMANQKDESQQPDFYRYFGNVLHEIFGDFNNAEEIYLEGLKLDQNHLEILTGLMNLYHSKRDDDLSNMAAWHWRAMEKFNRVQKLLEEGMKKDDFAAFLKLGEACLKMEQYEDAERHLRKALNKLQREKDQNAESEEAAANIYANLGVLFICRGFIKKAVRQFEEALKRVPNNLKIRSNLAEAYFKANQREKAEVEYKKILRISRGHIESHIGLGEVYTGMGDDGDWEMYKPATDHFTQALNLSSTETGSKKLKKKELAAVYYSRGYAQVRYFETAKIATEKNLLQRALVDFQRCYQNDPDHHKSARAAEKVKNSLSFSPDRTLEKVGPMLIIGIAFSVFLFSSLAFFFQKFCKISEGYHALFSFGSILFMVAGLYLPQILKLKIGAIEMEKSPVSQITTPISLGITK
jgi:tetratricopeptide (TPR) repeat protein